MVYIWCIYGVYGVYMVCIWCIWCVYGVGGIEGLHGVDVVYRGGMWGIDRGDGVEGVLGLEMFW